MSRLADTVRRIGQRFQRRVHRKRLELARLVHDLHKDGMIAKGQAREWTASSEALDVELAELRGEQKESSWSN